MKVCLRIVFAVGLLSGVARAVELPNPTLQEPLGGTLLLCGRGSVELRTRQLFLALAGGDRARIVAISSGVAEADLQHEKGRKLYFGSDAENAITVINATTREDAAKAEFADAVKNATGVWLVANHTSELEIYRATGVERELRALLARNGKIAAVSAASTFMSSVFVRDSKSSEKHTEFSSGFGVLSNILVSLRPEREQRLSSQKEPADTPGYARLELENEAAVLIQSRFMRDVGKGAAFVFYSRAGGREPSSVPLAKNPLDLLAISRTALARIGETFPPKLAPIPEIPAKAMLVIGGSGISDEGTKRFITHCGGVDAKIVVIPTALDDALNPAAFDELYEVKMLKRIGVKNVTVVHAKTRAEAETAAILDPIKNATGIWFSGGRQWRLVDKYLGTSAEKEMHALLERGGAIAGGSAGATIQGDYLVRGNPLGNVEMMVEGYERGLGFLKGVAIDQHFTQRKRFGDMTAFKKAVPHYLGIGIDENTALVVTGNVAEVVGEHVVSFYDKPQPLPEGARDYTVIRAGESYDLKARAKK